MENAYKSQEAAILAYLKEGNAITPIEALNKFRCFRLAATIHSLRKKHNIKMTMVTNGRKKFASYGLV